MIKNTGKFLSLVLLLVFSNVQAKTLFFKKGNLSGEQLNSTTLSAMGADANHQTSYYVVQFKNKILKAERDLLKKVNAEVIHYIPEDAYLVKVSSFNLKKLQSDDLVDLVVPYLPQWRVSSEFEPQSVFNAGQPVVVLLQATSNQTLYDIISTLRQESVVKANGKTAILKIPLGHLNKLSEKEGVEWIQPYQNPELMHIDLLDEEGPTLNEDVMAGDYTDLNGFESGTKIMKFDDAWSRGFTGQKQIVAMADTGLDTGDVNTVVKDLSGVIEGQVFGLFSDTWNDPMGHGTHVAGSVMGTGAQSNGLIMGGAYKASMIAQGMWSPLLNNLTVPPQLDELFQKAYDLGAKVHTNSWGAPSGFGEYESRAAQVDEFMWKNPDMLIIFAAGNSGVDESRDGRVDVNSIGPPATAKNCLTVGASENYLLKGGIQRPHGELRGGDQKWGIEPIASDKLSNNELGLAVFSSRGPTTDTRIKPDVVAPGTNILSMCSKVEGASELWGKYNDDYCYSGGTSMSTPLVAGAAAVVREYLTKHAGHDVPSAALMKAILMHTAFDMFPGQYGFRDQGQELLKTAPDSNQGFGRVDVEMATRTEGYYLALLDNKEGVNEQNPVEVDVDLKGAKNVKFTLVYTDAPGAPSASKALVNDINLEVEIDGMKRKGEDSVNNFEQVSFENISGNNAKVRVYVERLAETQGNGQPFALVVTKEN